MSARLDEFNEKFAQLVLGLQEGGGFECIARNLIVLNLMSHLECSDLLLQRVAKLHFHESHEHRYVELKELDRMIRVN